MKQRTAYAAAIVWTCLLIIALFLPGRHVPRQPQVGLDKVVHAVLFGGFVLFWILAWAKHSWPRSLGIVLVAIGLAFATEWAQGALMEGRTPDRMDSLADVVGTLIAWGLWMVFKGTRKRSGP